MPYFRGEPFEHVVHYVGGKVRRQGRGLAFWYLRMNSSISIVPLNVRDIPFVFSEVSSDHQSVTYQGQASYRFVDPERALEMLNLSVNPRFKNFESGDLELLGQRVTNIVNGAASFEIQSRDLATNIRNFDTIADAVKVRVASDPTIRSYGIEITSLVITSISPTPEVAKALEAQFREDLLKKADEAIYARRAAAIEEERKIKEREMATELAVESKRKEIIALKSDNELLQAESRGQAFAAESRYQNEQLKEELELWNQIDPARLAALGFKKMGEKGAQSIMITSEVLGALLQSHDSGDTKEVNAERKSGRTSK
jgi:regulator of protease activity HflC (stomatin/prohibitin superfamily)